MRGRREMRGQTERSPIRSNKRETAGRSIGSWPLPPSGLWRRKSSERRLLHPAKLGYIQSVPELLLPNYSSHSLNQLAWSGAAQLV